jgi:hypothetical protein
VRGYENILKTLNTDNQLSLIETTYKFKAAQPCSYIYPIYSVVKNRLRQLVVAATRHWGTLESSDPPEGDHKLKDQCLDQSTVERLNLELVCFDYLQEKWWS